MVNCINKYRMAAYNSTFAIGGVTCSADSLVVAESSVFRINFCGEKPAYRQSANRYGQLYYAHILISWRKY